MDNFVSGVRQSLLRGEKLMDFGESRFIVKRGLEFVHILLGKQPWNEPLTMI
jgi:hypothetical protein